MNEPNRQFDDVEGRIPDRFRTDLQGLFEPPGRVPPQVDKAIMDEARRRIAGRRRLIVRLRWAGGIAAAAVVIVGVTLYHGTTLHNHPSSIIDRRSAAAGRADIDGNGRVDILDALRLARHIEARGPDQAEWDLNGDGQVDRGDVDLVAFAAVRLDKGV